MKNIKSLRTAHRGAAAAALLVASVGVGLAAAAPASAVAQVCRPGNGINVGFGVVLEPCITSPTGGNGQLTAAVNIDGTHATTDVRAYIEIGVNCGHGLSWLSSTTTPNSPENLVVPGSSPGVDSGTVTAQVGCSYYAKSWIANDGRNYGDVEAGPLSAPF